MPASRKLTRDEAEEYTANLGRVAVGNFGLMEFARDTLKVPEALGISFDEWVTDHLGGFVRRSVEQRREAVRQLSGKRSEGGYYEKPAREVAEILGISENTVNRDRDVLTHLEEAQQKQIKKLALPEEAQQKAKKLTPSEKQAAIRHLIDEGKSNAEIAIDLAIGVSTVGKERTAYKRDKEQAKREAAAELLGVDIPEAPEYDASRGEEKRINYPAVREEAVILALQAATLAEKVAKLVDPHRDGFSERDLEMLGETFLDTQNAWAGLVARYTTSRDGRLTILGER